MAPPWKLAPDRYGKYPKITEFQNTPGKMKYQKYFEENDLLGYYVTSGGKATAPSIRPIYRGTLMLKTAEGKDKEVLYIFETHILGDRMTGFDYSEDPEGCALASIVSTALGTLETRIPKKKEKTDAAKQTRVRPKRRRK